MGLPLLEKKPHGYHSSYLEEIVVADLLIPQNK
jgi:hypothetical protein